MKCTQGVKLLQNGWFQYFFLNVASHHELSLTVPTSNSFLLNGHDLIGTIQPGRLAILGSIGWNSFQPSRTIWQKCSRCWGQHTPATNADEWLLIISVQLLLWIKWHSVPVPKKGPSNTPDSLFAVRVLPDPVPSLRAAEVCLYWYHLVCTGQLVLQPTARSLQLFSTLGMSCVCDFWLSWGIFDHLQCFKQSYLFKTSEPTLPNNLETPKLGRTFTSRAAGTANKQKKRYLVVTAVKTIKACHT